MFASLLKKNIVICNFLQGASGPDKIFAGSALYLHIHLLYLHDFKYQVPLNSNL